MLYIKRLYIFKAFVSENRQNSDKLIKIRQFIVIIHHFSLKAAKRINHLWKFYENVFKICNILHKYKQFHNCFRKIWKTLKIRKFL